MQSLRVELPQSWVEDRRQHPFKWLNFTYALFLYGFEYIQGTTEVFFPTDSNISLLQYMYPFSEINKCFLFPFGYILKYLLMLAVPIKNSLFGTLVAQHRTQVSGLETAVSATGQNIEFSYPFYHRIEFKAVAVARTQLVAVRSEKDDSMQITLVLSCALTSRVLPFSTKSQVSWLLLKSGLQEVTMMNLICKLIDVPPI